MRVFIIIMMHVYLYQIIPEHMIPDSSSDLSSSTLGCSHGRDLAQLGACMHMHMHMQGQSRHVHSKAQLRRLQLACKASQLQPQGSCSRKGRAAGHVLILESFIPA